MSSSQGPLLALAVPTIAAFFSYFWIKRKRVGSKSDPGDTATPSSSDTIKLVSTAVGAIPTSPTLTSSTEFRPFSRSLSGVDSAPIDIVIPPKLRASKSNPVVISDEDLDLEIEKANSIRYGHSFDATNKSNNCSEALIEKKKMSPPVMAPLVVEETFSVETPQIEEKNNVEVEEITLNSNEVQNQNNERDDSANHSPADVMLASSSVCSNSDNRSEGSNDSGKGGSNHTTSPTTSPTPKDTAAESTPSTIIYEFFIPQTLVGKLIGRHGSSVANIKAKSGARVIIRKHSDTDSKLKVCMIEGSQQEIDHALKIIRDKFPLKRFPEVTLEQVVFAPEIISMPISPGSLRLLDSATNDTRITCVIAPNHFFLHQPEHPTFSNLQLLNQFLNTNYNNEEAPFLPTPVLADSICVAFTENNWYRVAVLDADDQTGVCTVKFLDYGGSALLEYAQLRQIRQDFLTLPFQATECVLANIESTEENGVWREEAFAAIYELIGDQTRVLINVVDYKDNITYVNCYPDLGPDTVFLNEELVNRGFARWTCEDAQKQGALLRPS